MLQGLFGLGTGGLTGTGLGFGLLGGIPEVNSDYIFAAFGTEMGLLGTTVILFAFTLIVGAGCASPRRRARNSPSCWPPGSP